MTLVWAAGCSSLTHGDDPPIFRGYSSQFTVLQPARQAKLTPIQTESGQTIDLSHFRGKVVLLNFWATWCAPCAEEMPALDRLQAKRGGSDFEVVAVSIDRGGLATVAPFFRSLSLRHLKVYLDPQHRTAYFNVEEGEHAAFALYGLPISYVVDPRGRVMGYISGAAEWDSREAMELIRYYLRRGRR